MMRDIDQRLSNIELTGKFHSDIFISYVDKLINREFALQNSS